MPCGTSNCKFKLAVLDYDQNSLYPMLQFSSTPQNLVLQLAFWLMHLTGAIVVVVGCPLLRGIMWQVGLPLFCFLELLQMRAGHKLTCELRKYADMWYPNQYPCHASNMSGNSFHCIGNHILLRCVPVSRPNKTQRYPTCVCKNEPCLTFAF